MVLGFCFDVVLAERNFFQQVVQVSGWDMNWFFPTKNTIIYSKFFGLICLASQKRLIHNKFIKVFRLIYIKELLTRMTN